MSKHNPWWPCLSLPHRRWFKGKLKPAWIGQHKSPWSGGQGAGGTTEDLESSAGAKQTWKSQPFCIYVFSAVQSLSRVHLFVTPWTAARQASVSITNSRSLLKLMSMMPANHLILCRPLLPPSIFPSLRVFSIPAHRWVSSNFYWDSCGKLTRKLIKILGPWRQEHVVCRAPRPGVWIPWHLFPFSPLISSVRQGTGLPLDERGKEGDREERAGERMK